MIADAIWYASAAATGAGIASDLTVHGIQQWQRRRADIPEETLGFLGRFPLSLVVNFAFTFLFAYVYFVVGAGSGRAYLAGGLVWLVIVIPALASTRYMDDHMKAILTTRIFGWLFKVAAASAAINYFIG